MGSKTQKDVTLSDRNLVCVAITLCLWGAEVLEMESRYARTTSDPLLSSGKQCSCAYGLQNNVRAHTVSACFPRRPNLVGSGDIRSALRAAPIRIPLLAARRCTVFEPDVSRLERSARGRAGGEAVVYRRGGGKVSPRTCRIAAEPPDSRLPYKTNVGQSSVSEPRMVWGPPHHFLVRAP